MPNSHHMISYTTTLRMRLHVYIDLTSNMPPPEETSSLCSTNQLHTQETSSRLHHPWNLPHISKYLQQQQTPHTHPTHTHVYALPYKRHTPHKVDNWTCNYQQSNTYTPTKQATSTGTYTSYYHLLTQENKDWKEFTSSIQLVPIPNKLKFT